MVCHKAIYWDDGAAVFIICTTWCNQKAVRRCCIATITLFL